jgi:hypothetical protein
MARTDTPTTALDGTDSKVTESDKVTEDSKVTKGDLLDAWGLQEAGNGKLVPKKIEKNGQKYEMSNEEWLSSFAGAINRAAQQMYEAAQARGFPASLEDCVRQVRCYLVNKRSWAVGEEWAVGVEKCKGVCPGSLPWVEIRFPDRINRMLREIINVPANQLAKPRDKDKDRDRDGDEDKARPFRPFIRQVSLTPRDDAPHADPLPHSASAEEEAFLSRLDEDEADGPDPRQIVKTIVARWQAQSRYKQAKRLRAWIASHPDECRSKIKADEWASLDARWRNVLREMLGGSPPCPSGLAD